ncbi:MAG: hypothetical protein M1829_005309 [Trizodia sp. TS-e1964]|nr:MAG: hypothetical protein M1829_005309 [Trizodia sp. TS-e1964]
MHKQETEDPLRQQASPIFARVDCGQMINTYHPKPASAPKYRQAAEALDRRYAPLIDKQDLSTSISFDSSSSSTTMKSANDYSPPIYRMRRGRRYLHDDTLPYPLPCDLLELNRQNLRTLLLVKVFGAPFCSPFLTAEPPKKVLEVACGTGLWSSECHEHFSRLGYPDIEFTGLDIAPLAPDLNSQGVTWRFVKHDLRKTPLPFETGKFDFVFIKDLSLVAPTTGLQDTLMEEYLRILKPNGTLEAWESDYTLRTLLPNPPLPRNLNESSLKQADLTATYPLSAATSFTVPQNVYLQDYNNWISKSLASRKLTPVPCTLMGPMMLQEVGKLRDVEHKRFAILLDEVRWEREGIGGSESERGSSARKLSQSGASPTSKGKSRLTQSNALNPDQVALRQTALLTVVQMIEGLEPLLKESSGKCTDEWDRWWGCMMVDLLELRGAASGECLEVACWWGRKF